MIIVRLLLVLSLATIGGALVLYLFRRDRRYLRFIGQVAAFSLIVLAVVLVFFAAERLFAPTPVQSPGPTSRDAGGRAL